MSEITIAAPKAPDDGTRPSLEKTAWWVVFGVLALSIVVMLGAWN